MNVACPGCGTRYAVADEKVRGRRVRIACKHCSTPIVIDGTKVAGVSSTLPSGSALAAEARPPVPDNVTPDHRSLNQPSTTPSPTRASALPMNGQPISPPVGQRRASRAMRETIIGVAAPANAPVDVVHAPIPMGEAAVPANVPIASVRTDPAPTAIAVPANAPVGAAAAPVVPSRTARAMRQTIIGVAAPANAPNLEPALVPPQHVVTPEVAPAPTADALEPPHPATEKVAARPNLKRTIIGGLDAAPGSAPAPESVGLGIPAEKWNILIPKRGAVEMTAPDIVRAFAEGKLTRDTNVWREGFNAWEPLCEVDSLRTLFHRAGLALDPPAPRPDVAERPDDEITQADHDDHTPLDRPSGRPDIGPRATVRGQLAAISSAPAVAPGTSEDAETAIEPTPISKPAQPKARRRWWIWPLVFIAFSVSLALSYRTKQPRAAYAYLHRRGWDVPIDRTVNRVTPEIRNATQNYVVRPYRAVAQKLRNTRKK